MAGGLLVPMAQLLVARHGRRHMPRLMGMIAIPALSGLLFGPTVAGIVLQYAAWPWLFFVNVPIGILAIALSLHLLPSEEQVAPRPFDSVGFILISPGLILLLDALRTIAAEATPVYRWVQLFLAVLLIAAFITRSAYRGSTALVDVRLFQKDKFAASAATQFLSNALSIGGQMLLPLYFLSVRQASPQTTGFFVAMTGFGMLCSAPSVGYFINRFGSRPVAVAGSVLALCGTLPFCFIDPTFSGIALVFALFIRGVGIGAINLPSMSSAYAKIPSESVTHATTAINICQRLGGPLMTTGLAVMLEAYVGAGSSYVGSDLVSAFAMTFWFLCAVNVLCVFSALCLPARFSTSQE
jgi:MFS family permease